MGTNKQQKELLQLAMPASWWLTLAWFLENAHIPITGCSPDPWAVAIKVSEAVKKQFPEEAEGL